MQKHQQLALIKACRHVNCCLLGNIVDNVMLWNGFLHFCRVAHRGTADCIAWAAGGNDMWLCAGQTDKHPIKMYLKKKNILTEKKRFGFFSPIRKALKFPLNHKVAREVLVMSTKSIFTDPCSLRVQGILCEQTRRPVLLHCKNTLTFSDV